MAFSYVKNLVPADSKTAIYNIKEMLKSATWIAKASGTGSSFSNSSDIITSPSLFRWIRLQQPENSREIIFDFGGGSAPTLIYSPSAGFTSGGSATARQTASDEVTIWSGGSTYLPTGGTYRLQAGATSTSPHWFWFFTYPNAGGAPNSGLVFDPLVKVPTEDQDPLIWYRAPAGLSNLFTKTTMSSQSAFSETASQCIGYMKKGLVGQIFDTIPALHYNNQAASGTTTIPTNGVVNPSSSRDDILPILYGRNSNMSSPTGYKGISNAMVWTARNLANQSRLSVDATGDWIVAANVAFRWDGTALI